MSVKLTTMSATINCGQYSDIRPTVEADTKEEALKYLSDLARQIGNNTYADQVAPTIKKSLTVQLKTLTSIDGTKVQFDPASHTYYDEDGANSYLSGSTFASLTTTDFDSQFVAQKIAKDGLTADEVLKLWKAKNQVACDFGSALHESLEMFQNFHKYAAILGDESKVLPNNEFLADCVRNAFTPERKAETAMAEVFVASTKFKMCGSIDRLVFLDKDTRTVVIQDWKSNDLTKRVTFIPELRDAYNDIEKTKYGEYQFQLSFYAYILKALGYNVKECQIINLEGTEWKTYSFKPLDITTALEVVRGK